MTTNDAVIAGLVLSKIVVNHPPPRGAIVELNEALWAYQVFFFRVEMQKPMTTVEKDGK